MSCGIWDQDIGSVGSCVAGVGSWDISISQRDFATRRPGIMLLPPSANVLCIATQHK